LVFARLKNQLQNRLAKENFKYNLSSIVTNVTAVRTQTLYKKNARFSIQKSIFRFTWQL